MKHSSYQEDIFKFFARDELTNGMINAVAGSGKTYTMIEGLKHCSPNLSVLVCAFNKVIREEFASRISRPRTETLTYNAFGWRVCRKAFKSAQFDVEKTSQHLLHNILHGNEDLHKIMFGPTKRIVGIAKATMIKDGHELADNMDNICDDYNIELPKKINDALSIICGTYDKCIEDTINFDFDDQLFMPWKYDLTVPEFDLVLVDEYQDTSPIQSWLMSQAMGMGSQIVAGDPWQAIYSWRGATPDAMKLFQEKLNATELPLSICYRCPKIVVDEAKKIVPHIESSPEALIGILDTIKEDKMRTMISAGDFVLCRTTAPLIECCLKFIKSGVLAQVRGREIGSDLLTMLTKIGGEDVPDFISRLDEYAQTQSERLTRLNKEQQLIALEDRVACFRVLAEVCSTIQDMIALIQRIFVENTSKGITLMTAHKSKGLQAPKVFIIKPDQMPMKKNNPEEMRVKYVAITRAQEELYFVK